MTIQQTQVPDVRRNGSMLAAHGPTKIFITQPDGKEPEAGYFRVNLFKGQAARALGVVQDQTDQHWIVWLDGKIIGDSTDWQDAFAAIRRRGSDIQGYRISQTEYKDLIERREKDRQRGIDLDAPLNLNQIPVP